MSITDPMRQFDSRTVRRKIKSGRISESEYSEFLTELPDVSDNIRSRDDGGDDDGYEERIANRGRSSSSSAPAHHSVSVEPPARAPQPEADPFADIPSAATLVPSPSAPIIPPAAAAPLPTPSFDLPPLDPPSPSTPSSGSNDDEE